MAEEIRGLNVKFDADFSEFKKSMKSAEKDVKSTEKQLKTLKDSLNIKWDPQKFKEAQKQAQQAIDATEKKADILRKRLSEMDRAGVTDKTRDEYNYLQEELSKTELSTQKLRLQMESLDDIRLKNLTSGIDNATSKLDKAAQKTKIISTTAAGLTAGLFATGLKTVSKADEIATLATQYEMSTTALQRFNYVALQTDTESESLYKAFTKVRAGIADLSAGVSSTATKALQDLGLNFSKFEGTEDQFYAIIDSMANMEDQTKMLSLANDIFGERFATNLLPLIYAGTDAINQYKQEFEATGAMTEEQVQELSEFDNVLNGLKTQYANVALQLGTSLLPLMKSFSKTLTDDVLPVLKDIVEWFGNLDEDTQKMIVTLLLLTATLSPALKLMSSIGGVVSGIITWLRKLDKATLTTYGKWGLLVASIGSLFTVIANWSKMNPVQKVIGLLGALAAASLSAALAFGVFHSAWSIGTAIAGIVAGIAAVTAAVKSAGEDIGSEVSFDASTYSSNISLPEYTLPASSQTSGNTYNESSYIDNSNVVVNIEKNEYMSEDDIIRAVNKGLREAKQART